jgi:uncharacterized alpha-E superfamily protein
VSTFSLLAPQHAPVRLSRGGADLPSRAADHLYWLGRYSERAEVIARLARVVATRLSELSSDSDLQKSTEISALLTALRAQTHFLYSADIPVEPASSMSASEAALASAVLDVEHDGSLASVVRHTLRAGRVVRDRISTDTYRVLATLDEDLTDLRAALDHDSPTSLHELLNQVVLTMAAFSGLAMESMSRGQAWMFLDLGRRLERAIGMVTLLRSTLVAPSERESALLDAVLEIADSAMTYRRRYLATLQVAPVLDLLLSDETNPRSVAFQLASLTEHFTRLPALETHAGKSSEHRLALAMRYEIELCEVERLCTLDQSGHRPLLDAILRKLGTQLPRLSDSLSESYLAHARMSRHLSGSPLDRGFQDRDGDPT